MVTTKSPELMRLYNLPEHVKGGLPIYGYKNKQGKEVTLYFDSIDEMHSNLRVDGKNEVVRMSALTPVSYSYDDEKYHFEFEEETNG